MKKRQPALAAGATLLLALFGGAFTQAVFAQAGPDSFVLGLLPDTQGGTDEQGQAHVSLHPMEEVLAQLAANGADTIIHVGDMTDHGSPVEFEEWTQLAAEYRDQGIEFLPIMGNHETSYATMQDWVSYMSDFIPADAVHMPGYEWVNYYVVRDNVLIFGISYYNLPIAFDWIKQTIETVGSETDHIVVASHDSLIGAKYGQTREQIVDGTKDDDWVFGVQQDIRSFFADHDVIFVSGHEHQYQRSVISDTTILQTMPSGSTPATGNYRMNVFTQIIIGNASYKGYEYRYGERDLVQAVVAHRNATLQEGVPYLDVNASLLTFTGDRVDYASYLAEHTATSNDPAEDFDADWVLMDAFSRTTNRCETIVYPNSMLPETRPVLVLNPRYETADCLADDGSRVSLVGGVNDTFNRTDSTTRTMGYTPGLSRAESLNDLMRLSYQWLFQVHERWSPNLNSAQRVVLDPEADELIVPATTIDLKEHVTTSWLPAEAGTASDIVIISGTQNQTGTYQDGYGVQKDIETDAGLPMSQTDGEPKAPVVLPQGATKSWDISNAVSDAYAVQFTASQGGDVAGLTLGMRGDDGWQALAPNQCVIEGAFDAAYIQSPPARSETCESAPLVGYDAGQEAHRWWTVLTTDAELALVSTGQ
ncbi:metallophosphoesterase family protein [Pelagibacterium xiamenense]|uniref:metallophosphoesterase family protein n=1 Tax=Pelagibacterium xiamenense TaxID=2901140 RepID=UPI001E46427C|nr:metallophosphoesterase [Pelagibacterium xiamenense]MCD7060064.1 metallophosphoesterase [Pelagibacterium xiamenense]